MKERLKRLLMLLGAVVLLVCRDGVWVMAEEDTTVESLSVGQASEVKEDTVPEQESKETDGDKNEKQNPADMGNRMPGTRARNLQRQTMKDSRRKMWKQLQSLKRRRT